MRNASIRSLMILLGSSLAFLGLAAGIYVALNSSLFLVRVIEVNTVGESEGKPPPVDSVTIQRLAAVPVGEASLFALDLELIRKRILSNSWIKSVEMHKLFPHTLSIKVFLRQPVAVFQKKNGQVSYIDQDGNIFGEVRLFLDSNLPVLSGFSEGDFKNILRAVSFSAAWLERNLHRYFDLSALNWNPADQTIRGIVLYQMDKRENKVRTYLDLGQDLDGSFELSIRRLSQVLQYLAHQSIYSQNISLNDAKKIVVKTARGS